MEAIIYYPLERNWSWKNDGSFYWLSTKPMECIGFTKNYSLRIVKTINAKFLEKVEVSGSIERQL